VPQYLPLSTLDLQNEPLHMRSQLLPELVHLEDPAWTVMRDFRIKGAFSIAPNESIDNALQEMKIQGIHVLLVTNTTNQILGIISIEDILGEKPIKIIQQRRIQRHKVEVKMVMSPTEKVILLDSQEIQSAKVGNIVSTLKETGHHYALVVHLHPEKQHYEISGLFNSSQISRQLHMDLASRDSDYSIADNIKKNT
jgi:CBS-domain-containing membrane protein